MKKIFILFFAGIVQLTMAQEAQVKKTVETFFAGLNATDVAKIKTVCADDMILQSVAVHTAANKFTQETAAKFYEGIEKNAGKAKFEERVKEYKIATDGNIAHVWVPYEFYINNEFSHKGANSFELVKFKEGWKIVYVIDSREP
ncbi:nuclear transport factor 2 family protein [Flavobacterium psychrotrophum]|uniref:nuclear transport factor 2 family protein n=1 Tax=Flavobacterium psychrotrophum TaxID=2294119 RepID=UPI000E32145E|nr:nuclear transport factor 2 family protein [Flavobacterium psychrotrophum]